MKTLKMVAMVMMCVILAAGFAVADDTNVSLDNRNDINATGGNAASNQTQTQWEQQQQSMVNKTPLQLLGLQYGTSFINPSTPVPGGDWKLYHSAVYSYFTAEEVGRMKLKFQFSDLWPGNWKTRLHVSMIGARISGNPVGISMMNYWPKFEVNKGDKVIMSINVNGDANIPEESFLGMAASTCMEEAGSSRFAIMTKLNSDAVSTGFSVSIGGAVAQASGTKGATGTGGGQIGTIRGSVEQRGEFEVLCMNDGPLDIFRGTIRIEQRTTPVVQPPAVELVCDWTIFERRIIALKEAVKHCKKPCLNNELLRKQIGDAYVQWFNCTGKTNPGLLRKAAEHYAIGERDFLNGREPDGTKTRSMQNAQELVYQIRYNWSWCVYMLDGYDHAMTFAGVRGLSSAPEHFEELKF